jgi:hypothetical protein
MSVFTWFRDLISPAPSAVPWETRDGKRLRWPASDCPVNVYLDAGLIEPDVSPFALVMTAIRGLRAAGVRVLLLPMSPTGEMLASFQDSPKTVRGILIHAVRVHPGPDQAYKCNTVHRWDSRSGFLRSAEIDWLMIGDQETDRANIVHELGHALGLAHQAETVMAEANARSWDGQGMPAAAQTRRSIPYAWYTAEQLKELLRVYGGTA